MNAETPSSDLLLISESLAGRPEAFRRLVEKYQPLILDLCSRMLQDDPEAEDVTQETFVTLYQYLPRYKAGHKVSNWLYSIALNRCRSILRRRKILRIFSLEALQAPSQEPVEWAGSELPLLDQLEGQEAEASLERLVAELPERLRAPFVLRYLRSLSDPEIAEILNTSINHVRVKLFRARSRLWKQFKKRNLAGVIEEDAKRI